MRTFWLATGGVAGALALTAGALSRSVTPPPADTGSAARMPEVGELLIAELMVAPGSSNDEWFEVQSLAGDDLDLEGCVVSSGSSSHTITGALAVASGERLVFYRDVSTRDSDCIDLDCAVVADYLIPYSASVTFSNSATDDLTITCDAGVVDTVSFNWTAFDDGCADAGGCALHLEPAIDDADDHDDATAARAAWGLTTDTYTDVRGAVASGTPGATNSCADCSGATGGDTGDSGVVSGDWPAAGQVVITELMPAPGYQYDEWFELQNVGDAAVDLKDCVISSTSDSSTASHTIASSVGIAAGGRSLFYKLVSSTSDTDCIDDADVCYGSLAFGNSGSDDLQLSCGGELIDAVTFDWDGFDRYCDAEGSCSISLDTIDADANDDATALGGAWCLSDGTYTNNRGVTTAGSPGGENDCAIIDTGTPIDTGDTDTGSDVEMPDPCGAGDVLITELMPAPKVDNSDEFVELYGYTGACDLQGCTLSETLTEDPWTDIEYSHTIDDDDLTVPVQAGQHVILAKGTAAEAEAGITWTNEDGSTVTADYALPYQSIYLKSELRYVHLTCGDTLVDSAPMDWEAFEDETGGCPEGGCSINLYSGLYTPDGNDDLQSWCIPPVEGNTTTYTDLDGESYELVSTLGRTGDCQTYDWPAVGEVAFTEVMVSPADTAEWFEIASLADGDRELTLCTVTRYRIDELGERASEVSTTLGADGSRVQLGSGALQLFSKSECILSGGADTASAGEDTAGESSTADDCEWGEVIYGSLSFSEDETEHLELVCPNADRQREVVDDIVFHATARGVRKGHSLMLSAADLSGVSADGNDDETAWCEAGFTQQFCEASDGNCNYGTPGELGECISLIEGPPGTVCRCSAAGRSGWQWAPVLAFALALRRRRRSSER